MKKTRKHLFLAELEQVGRMPDESSIRRFRQRLERHKLSNKIWLAVNELLRERGLLFLATTTVDATLIATPTPTKNKDQARDPGMHSDIKGAKCLFSVKAHNINMDAESGLVITARCSSGHFAHTVEAKPMLDGQESTVFGDAGSRRLKTAPMQKQSSLGKQLLGSCEARR